VAQFIAPKLRFPAETNKAVCHAGEQRKLRLTSGEEIDCMYDAAIFEN
jgi:hypothetical protein